MCKILSLGVLQTKVLIYKFSSPANLQHIVLRCARSLYGRIFDPSTCTQKTVLTMQYSTAANNQHIMQRALWHWIASDVNVLIQTHTHVGKLILNVQGSSIEQASTVCTFSHGAWRAACFAQNKCCKQPTYNRVQFASFASNLLTMETEPNLVTCELHSITRSAL